MTFQINKLVVGGSIALATVFTLVYAPIPAMAADYSGGYDYYDTYTPPSNPSVGGYDYYDTYTPPAPSYTEAPHPDIPDQIVVVVPAPTCTLNISKASIVKGESVTLTWSSTNAFNASLDTVGGVTVNGSRVMTPTQSMTYKLNIKGTNGAMVYCYKVVTVTAPQPAPTCTLTASESAIVRGETSVLSWHTTNGATINLTGFGAVGLNDSRMVSPQNTTMYVLTVKGTNGKLVTCSKTITVTVPQPPQPTCTLSVNQSSIVRGQGIVLTWSSTNASSGSINNGIGAVATNGSTTLYPTQNTTYTGTFVGQGGSVTCSVSVVVTTPNPSAPTCTLSASPTYIVEPGQAVTLSWSTTNASFGSISHISNVSPQGSTVVYPTQNTTYTGTFYGQGGSVTCSTTVTIAVVPPPYDNAPSCTIIINNSYNNNYYTPNQPVVIAWSSQYAQSGWINNGIGSINLSGSRTVYPTQTTTYIATFIGQNGQTVTCSVTINVNAYVPPPVYPNTPYITLSSVPYTGLDLGPVGTALYWGFLVLWSLFAAYLIVVKRIQNRVARSIKSFLFGSTSFDKTQDKSLSTSDAHAPAHQHSSFAGLLSTADLEVIANTLRSIIESPIIPQKVAPKNDSIDEFVLSQINRTRRA